MTKSQKVHKLANAIREFRGVYNASLGNPAVNGWIRPPNPTAEGRVRACLERLDLNPSESVERIMRFKTFDEMNEWLSKLTA